MELPLDDKVFIIFLCGSLTTKKAARKFNETYPDKDPISKEIVRSLRDHFKETGSVMNVTSRAGDEPNSHVMDHFLSGLDVQNGGWPAHRIYQSDLYANHQVPIIPTTVGAVGTSAGRQSPTNSLIVPSSSRHSIVKHETDATEYEALEAFQAPNKTKPARSKGKNRWDTKKICPVCAKVLSRGDKLRNHMRIHTNNFPYNCEQCGNGFLRSEGLRVHMRVHTGERPFVCQVCGNSYTRKDKLTRHAINHTGLRPFVCPTCGKSFTRKDKMQRHSLTHKVITFGDPPAFPQVGGLGLPTENTRAFPCPTCGRSFSCKDKMQRHTLTHKCEKPFTCAPCDLEFNTQREFSQHNEKKHPERVRFTPAQFQFPPTPLQLPPLHTTSPSTISLIPIATSSAAERPVDKQ